ncbi:synaptosomal-associated protein 29-like [Calliopsis andreniformis]|uniref:synaptosomal-associated protein 29-like n=1 Tax=Calliopsis andreniformis TaxID=337506 RepID=UPI003FCE5CE2
MASQNYLRDSTNPFFSIEDDVDDETFLKSTPSRSSGSTSYNHYNFDDLEQKRQQLLQRRKEIEERTIQSSERSISLLRDSEQIGAATAEELIRQREQLERTEKRLNDINSTLRFSQKHIQGIKSVFGSLKNYLSGKSLDAPISSTNLSGSVSSESMTSPALSNSLGQVQTNLANTSPALKLHGLDNEVETNNYMTNNVSKRLEKNLNEMSGSIARLKGLAIGLSEEIDMQNDLIDNITDEAEKADIMLQRQNKDLTHLLKK